MVEASHGIGPGATVSETFCVGGSLINPAGIIFRETEGMLNGIDGMIP
jgi:hypothetical protein